MVLLLKNFHEDRLVGLTLAFIGGAMDGYTYIHYGTFATAQTGNLVMAIIQAFDQQWTDVGKKLLSTFFFFLGILSAKFLIDFCRSKKFYTWRLIVLYYEAFIFFLISLTPINHYPALVTILISFTAAIQWISFDKINGIAYTNLFTTGNLKGLASNLYDYLTTKNRESKKKASHFLFVVSFFLLGVVSSVGLYDAFKWEAKAILLTAFVCLVLALFESFMLWRFYRLEKLK